jgi:RNA polymerase sigma-70 factor (ECF subfamily)
MVQDDSQLVTRVLSGEKTAFGLLIGRYRTAAIKLARRLLDDTFEAEDVTQEALLQAFFRFGVFAESGFFWPLAAGYRR